MALLLLKLFWESDSSKATHFIVIITGCIMSPCELGNKYIKQETDTTMTALRLESQGYLY